MKNYYWIIIFSIVLIDQIFKIYVKTHFELNSSFYIFSFFRIYFIENPGMAYGINLGYGKIEKKILSITRIIFVLFIFYILNKKKNCNKKYIIIPIILILSGSLGNLLDNILYGILFNKGLTYNEYKKKWISYPGISRINFNGYSSLLEGCGVDMLYFPIINSSFNTPFFGEFKFKFFNPIFNISDVSIFIGIVFIFLFKRKIINTIFF